MGLTQPPSRQQTKRLGEDRPMTTYLDQPAPPTTSEGMQRLRMVAQMLTREGDETVAEIASTYGWSRQGLYLLSAMAASALEPRAPGPVAGWREEAKLLDEVDRLRRENDELRVRILAQEGQILHMVEVNERQRDRLELVCFSHHVSLRGTQEIIEVAWGENWRPGLDGLQGRMKERGQVALNLLGEARSQVASDLRCVMGDDVYFHKAGVKVVAEPESMTMLNVGRWTGSSGLDWVVWLEEYSQLTLLVSDLGNDLVGAATQLELAQSADYFHEMRWLDRKLFTPLSRSEARARARAWEALDRATRPQGPGRRLSPAKVAAADAQAETREGAFFVALEVGERLRELYEPVNPATGRLWTRDEADTAIDEMIAKLAPINHPAGKRAMRHLRTHRARYAAHHVMFDCIEVQLCTTTSWNRRAVLNGLIHLWNIRRELADPDAWVDYATFKDRQRLSRELDLRLRRACLNLDDVASELLRQLRFPKRSSSGVESLNSKLRVLQMVHRNVSDEMLGLVALAWNLTPRKHSRRRKGQSPYGMLGIDIGQTDRPWYDVLLDAQAQHRAAA